MHAIFTNSPKPVQTLSMNISPHVMYVGDEAMQDLSLSRPGDSCCSYQTHFAACLVTKTWALASSIGFGLPYYKDPVSEVYPGSKQPCATVVKLQTCSQDSARNPNPILMGSGSLLEVDSAFHPSKVTGM